MSYISLLKNIAQNLNQPSGIAAIASVGIHGLLGLTLPYLSVFSSEEPAESRTVELMALTPTELSRIPDLSLPPIPPYIYQQTPLTAGSLPIASLTPPLNQSSNLSQSGITPETLKQQLARQSRTKITRGIYPSPIWQRRRLTSNDIKNGVDPKNSRLQIATNSNNRNDRVPVLNSNPDIAAITANLPGLNNPANPNLTTPQNQQQRGNEVATTRGLPDQNLQPSPASSPNNQVNRDLVAWIQQQLPEERMILGSYPKEACNKKLKGTAIYQIWVNDESQIIQMQLARSSGSDIFDRQGQEDIKSLRFNNRTGNPKPYRITVSFEYKEEKCQAANPTPSPESNQTETPALNQAKPAETNQTETPESNQTKPPVDNQAETPESNQTKPPVDNQAETPESNQTKPPVDNQRQPEEANRTKPEQNEQIQPQASREQSTVNSQQ